MKSPVFTNYERVHFPIDGNSDVFPLSSLDSYLSGMGIGLLMAPASRKETRNKIASGSSLVALP